MLLRGTKKFFHKTIQGFKSLFNGSEYEKLPKTTPPRSFNTFSYSTNGDIESAYQSTTNYNVEQRDKLYIDTGKSNKTIVSSSTRQEEENMAKFKKQSVVKNSNLQSHGGRMNGCVRQGDYSYNSYSKSVRDGRISSVVEKLKEMEVLDTRNAEHALDIQEVFHYYSRLTCPAYLDIVDKFFMEVYAEFSSSLSTPSRGYNSKLKQHVWRP